MKQSVPGDEFEQMGIVGGEPLPPVRPVDEFEALGLTGGARVYDDTPEGRFDKMRDEEPGRLETLAKRLDMKLDSPEFRQRMTKPPDFATYSTLAQRKDTGNEFETDTINPDGSVDSLGPEALISLPFAVARNLVRGKGTGLGAAIVQFGSAGGVFRRREDATLTRLAAGQEIEVGDTRVLSRGEWNQPVVRKYKKIEDMSIAEQNASIPKELRMMVDQFVKGKTGPNGEDYTRPYDRAAAIYDLAKTGEMLRQRARDTAAEELAIREELTSEGDGFLNSLEVLAAKGLPTVGYGNTFLVGKTGGAALVSGMDKTTEMLSAEIDPDTGEVLRKGADYTDAIVRGYAYGAFEAASEKYTGDVLGGIFKGADKMLGGHIGKILSKGADKAAAKLGSSAVGRSVVELAKGVQRIAGQRAFDNYGTEYVEEAVQQWSDRVFARKPSENSTPVYAKNVLNESTGQVEQVAVEPGSDEEIEAADQIRKYGDKAAYVQTGTRMLSVGEKSEAFLKDFGNMKTTVALAEGFFLQSVLTLGGGAMQAYQTKGARAAMDRSLLAAGMTNADLVRMSDEQKAQAFEAYYGDEARREKFAEVFKDAGEMLSASAQRVQDAQAWQDAASSLKPNFKTDLKKAFALKDEGGIGETEAFDEASGIRVTQSVQPEGVRFEVADQTGELQPQVFSSVEDAQAGAEKMSQLRQAREADMNNRAEIATRMAQAFAPGRKVVLVQRPSDMLAAVADEYKAEGAQAPAEIAESAGLTTPGGTVILDVSAITGVPHLVRLLTHETGHSAFIQSGLRELFKGRSVDDIVTDLQQEGIVAAGDTGRKDFIETVTRIQAGYKAKGQELDDAAAVEEVLAFANEGATPVIGKKFADGIVGLYKRLRGAQGNTPATVAEARRVAAGILHGSARPDVALFGGPGAWAAPTPKFEGDPVAQPAVGSAPGEAPADAAPSEQATPAETPATAEGQAEPATPPTAEPAVEPAGEAGVQPAASTPPVTGEAQGEAPTPSEGRVPKGGSTITQRKYTPGRDGTRKQEIDRRLAAIGKTVDSATNEELSAVEQAVNADDTGAAVAELNALPTGSQVRVGPRQVAEKDANGVWRVVDADGKRTALRVPGGAINMSGALVLRVGWDSPLGAQGEPVVDDKVKLLKPRRPNGSVGPYGEMSDEDVLNHVIYGDKPATLSGVPKEEAERLAEIAKKAGIPHKIEDNPRSKGGKVFYAAKTEDVLNQLIRVHSDLDSNGEVRDQYTEGKLLGYTDADIEAYSKGRIARGLSPVVKPVKAPVESPNAETRADISLDGGTPADIEGDKAKAEAQQKKRKEREDLKDKAAAPITGTAGDMTGSLIPGTSDVPLFTEQAPKAEEKGTPISEKEEQPPAPAEPAQGDKTPAEGHGGGESGTGAVPILARLNKALADEKRVQGDKASEKRAVAEAAWGLMGPANASARQDAIEFLTGNRPPKAKAGVHEVEAALHTWLAREKDTKETEAASAAPEAKAPPREVLEFDTSAAFIAWGRENPEKFRALKKGDVKIGARAPAAAPAKADAVPDAGAAEATPKVPEFTFRPMGLTEAKSAYDRAKEAARKVWEAKYAGATTPAEAPSYRLTVVENGTVTHPGAVNDSDLLPLSVLRAAMYAPYADGKSSRETPVPEYDAKVGAWYADDTFMGPYGRDIDQLLLLNPATLTPHEQMVWRNEEGRGWDSEKYRAWADEGKIPPPIRVLETENGQLGVTDGHRRFAAALAAGRPILALVSPAAPTPSLARESYSKRLIATSLTADIAKKQAAGEMPEWNDTPWSERVKPFLWHTQSATPADTRTLGEKLAAALTPEQTEQARAEANHTAATSSEEANAGRVQEKAEEGQAPSYRLDVDIEQGRVPLVTDTQIPEAFREDFEAEWKEVFGGVVKNPTQLAQQILSMPDEMALGYIQTADAIADYLLNQPGSGFTQLDDHISMGVTFRNVLAERRNAARPSDRALEEGKSQVPYYNMSGREDPTTMVVPRDLGLAMSTASEAFLQRHPEGVVEYVTAKMGWTTEQLMKRLDGSQIDTLAFALERADDGTGFVVGSMTGAGKGRIMAAVMTYHIKNGRIPVFITAQAKLFTDIWRDIVDIGEEATFRPLVFNRYVAPESAEGGEDNDEAFSMPPFFQRPETDTAIRTGKLPASASAVFLTYSQLQQLGTEPTQNRIALLKKLLASGNGALVLDEAHLAAGANSQRGGVLRELASLPAAGVTFSSATFAKRGENMGLYKRAGYSNFFQTDEEMEEVLQKGGVPYQQFLAAKLTEGGYYTRHELDYEGVVFDKIETIDTLGTPQARTELAAREESTADTFNAAVRGVLGFLSEVRRVNMELPPKVPKIAMQGQNIASTLHNIAAFIYTALKAETVANAAIEELRAGRAPVITLYNTNQALLDVIGEGNAAEPGAYLRRLAERAISIRIGDDEYASILTLPGYDALVKSAKVRNATELRRQAENLMRAVEVVGDQLREAGISASPIDKIRETVEDAGFKFAELTGRSKMVRNGIVTARVRPKSADTVVNAFNSSLTADDKPNTVLVINSSAAAGLSIHSSPKFKNHADRVMFVLQPAWDINEMMQLFGRVNRKNQLSKPIYKLVFTTVAGEQRNAAILMQKLRSLSANTSGVSKAGYGADSNDAMDFMNAFGERAWNEMQAAQHPAVAQLRRLSGVGEFRSVTAKAMFLPSRDQDAFMRDLQARVASLQEHARESGSHDLEAGDVGRVPLTPEQLSMGGAMRAYETAITGTATIHTAREAQALAEAGRAKSEKAVEEARAKIAALEDAAKSSTAQANYERADDVLRRGLASLGNVYRQASQTGVHSWFIPLEMWLPPSGQAHVPSDWRIKVAFNNIRGTPTMSLATFDSRLWADAGRAREQHYNDNLTTREIRTLVAGDITAAITGSIVAAQAGAVGLPQIVKATPADGNFPSFVLMMPRNVSVANAKRIISSRRVAVTDIRELQLRAGADWVSVDADRIRVRPDLRNGVPVGAAFEFNNAVPKAAKSQDVTVRAMIDAAKLPMTGIAANRKGFVESLFVGVERANQALANLAALHPALQPTRVETNAGEVGGASAPAAQAPSYRFSRIETEGDRIERMDDSELREYLISSVGYEVSQVVGLIRPQLLKMALDPDALYNNLPPRQATAAPGAGENVFARRRRGGAGPSYRLDIGEEGGYYSTLETAVASLPEGFKAPGFQFKARLEGARNKGWAWKQQEADETGFTDWLKMRQEQGSHVTKAEALEFLKQNGVKIETVRKGGLTLDPEREGIQPNGDGSFRAYVTGPNGFTDKEFASHEDAEAWIREMQGQGYSDTKFSQYAPEGGVPGTYRELLLTVPGEIEKPQFATGADGRVTVSLGGVRRRMPNMEAARAWASTEGAMRTTGAYISPHWSELNVIAHMLMDERRIPLDVLEKTHPELAAKLRAEGKTEARALHMIEGQSDLHQEGASKGYREPGFEESLFADVEKLGVKRGDASIYTLRQAGASEELLARFDRWMSDRWMFGRGAEADRVPNLPMKGDAWKRLVIRTMLREAAQGGYDLLTWSTGEDRFKKWGSQRVEWKRGVGTDAERDRLAMEMFGRPYSDLTKPDAMRMVNDAVYHWQVAAQEQHGGEHAGQNLEEQARERGVLLEQRGQTVRSKEDLRRVIEGIRRGDETNVDKLTERIWQRMQNEPEGTSLPRKEFFEFLYDQSFVNEARDVLKKLDKGAALGIYTPAGVASAHGVPITPELRGSVAGGVPSYRLDIGDEGLGAPVRVGNLTQQGRLEDAAGATGKGFTVLDHLRGASKINIPTERGETGEYDWFWEQGGYKAFSLPEQLAFFRRGTGNVDALAEELGFRDTEEFVNEFLNEIERSRELYRVEKLRQQGRREALREASRLFPALNQRQLGDLMGASIPAALSALPADAREVLRRLGEAEGDAAVRHEMLTRVDLFQGVLFEMWYTLDTGAKGGEAPVEIQDTSTFSRPEVAAGGETVDTIQNTKARIAVLAATLSMAPIPGVPKLTNAQAISDAQAAIDAAGPEAAEQHARDLIAQRLAGARKTALTKSEDALMLWYHTRLDARQVEADTRVKDAFDQGDLLLLAAEERERQRVTQDAREFLTAMREYGSAAGQALQALQMRVDRSFNIVAMHAQAVKDNGDLPLTPEQYARLRERIARLEKAFSDYVDAATTPTEDADLAKKLAELEAKIADLTGSIPTQEGAIAADAERLARLRAELATLSEDATMLSERRAALVMQIEAVNREIQMRQAMKQDNAALETRLRGLVAQLDALDAEAGGVGQTRLDDLNSQIATLEDELVQRRAAYAKAVADLDTANRRMKRVREMKAKLEKATGGAVQRAKIRREAAAHLYGEFKAEVEKAQVERMATRWRGANPLGKFWLSLSVLQNTIRAMQASGDESVAGRQLGKLGLGHPILWLRAFVDSQKIMALSGVKDENGRPMGWQERSDRALFESDSLLREHPLWKVFRAAGGDWIDLIADPKSIDEMQLPITAMMRTYVPRWMGGNAVANMIDVSNNHYAGMSNMLRFSVFCQMYADLLKMNNGEAPSEADLRAAASTVDIFGGRGDLSDHRIKAAVTAANSFLYSARLATANVQFVTRAAGILANPAHSLNARRVMAKEYARTLGGYAAMTGLFWLLSRLFSDDPDKQRFQFKSGHPAFLQFMVGQSRVDLTGGFATWARYLLALGGFSDRTSTESGLNTGSRGPLEGDVFMRLLRSKLAPLPGFLFDAFKGENYEGSAAGPRAESHRPGYDRRYLNMLDSLNPSPLMAQSLVELVRGDEERGVHPVSNPLLITLGAVFEMVGVLSAPLPVSPRLSQEVARGYEVRAKELESLKRKQRDVLGSKKLQPWQKARESAALQNKIDRIREQ